MTGVAGSRRLILLAHRPKNSRRMRNTFSRQQDLSAPASVFRRHHLVSRDRSIRRSRHFQRTCKGHIGRRNRRPGEYSTQFQPTAHFRITAHRTHRNGDSIRQRNPAGGHWRYCGIQGCGSVQSARAKWCTRFCHHDRIGSSVYRRHNI